MEITLVQLTQQTDDLFDAFFLTQRRHKQHQKLLGQIHLFR